MIRVCHLTICFLMVFTRALKSIQDEKKNPAQTDAFRIPPGLPKIDPSLPYIGGGKFTDKLKSFLKEPISQTPLKGIPPSPYLGHGPSVSYEALPAKTGPGPSTDPGPKKPHLGHGPVITNGYGPILGHRPTIDGLENLIDVEVSKLKTMVEKTQLSLANNESFKKWLLNKGHCLSLPKYEEELLLQIDSTNLKKNLYPLYIWTDPKSFTRKGFLQFLKELGDSYSSFTKSTSITPKPVIPNGDATDITK